MTSIEPIQPNPDLHKGWITGCSAGRRIGTLGTIQIRLFYQNKEILTTTWMCLTAP
jgi:hypothetical protein